MRKKSKQLLRRTVLATAFALTVSGSAYANRTHQPLNRPVHPVAAKHVVKRQARPVKIVHKAKPQKPQTHYVSRAMLPLSAKPMTQDGFDNSAKSALVMDSDSGKVVYGKNVHDQRKVASTAKLMTLFLTQRKASQTHGWNQKVRISKQVAEMSNDDKDGVGSELKLKAGHEYTVSDLYQSALIESSDSASIALGEWVAGDNAKFVKMMNDQGHAWHLHAHFISASGLENDSISPFGFKVAGGKTDGNQMSAMDLGIVAQHLIHEFPNVTQWSSQSSAVVNGTHINNVNANLKGKDHYVPNVDGLKTGFTPSAGYCYVGTKKVGHHHRIIVLLDDPHEFQDGQNLLNK